MDVEPLRCCVVGCCLSQAVRVTLLASQKSFLSDMCGVLYWQSLEENQSSMVIGMITKFLCLMKLLLESPKVFAIHPFVFQHLVMPRRSDASPNMKQNIILAECTDWLCHRNLWVPEEK